MSGNIQIGRYAMSNSQTTTKKKYQQRNKKKKYVKSYESSYDLL